MRKLLLASHGPLARAMRETLQLFCGEDPRVKVLCAYVDEDTMDVNELIDFWERSRDPADQWIVITDVYGGSVNNAFMERLGDDSLRLIAGMSLPLVLEVFSQLSTLDDAELAALVSSARQKGTRLWSLPNSVEEDEDF